MTVFFRTTDSITINTAALTLADGDELYVVPGVRIASTNNDAVSSPGGVTVENHGTIFGYLNGLNIGTSGSTSYVFNGSDGVISGSTQEQAIKVHGPFSITNNGEISCPGGSGYGVYVQGVGKLYNYGSIVAGFGFINVGASAGDVATIYNYGTMTGSTEVYDGTLSVGSERIFNAGTMTGDVLMSSTAGGLFDSSLGRVFGTVTLGSGGGMAIGGTTGGSIVGSSGADVEIANQGQIAADNAAKATLNGGGGINALYGGGAFNTFMAGNSNGGYNQIWGGASKMAGVADYTNNTLSFATATHGVYVDLLAGHNAYVSSATNWTGAGVFEDAIVNVPNVVGSNQGDLIQADSGIDRVTGGGGADQLYAGSGAASQDTFIYTAYGDSNTVTGYDTIVGFKIGKDKIDLSALHTDGSHLAISTAGTSNTLYVEKMPGTFNSGTDLALIVNTTATGGLHASDFVF